VTNALAYSLTDSCYYSDRSRAASGDEPLSPVTPLSDDLRRLPTIDDAMTAVENARNLQDRKILVKKVEIKRSKAFAKDSLPKCVELFTAKFGITLINLSPTITKLKIALP
jgi:hypothetical protein